MKKKYIIDLNPDCVEGEYLRIPARIAGEEQWLVTKAALTPYAEPDLEQVRKEGYEDGYKTAKVQCNIQAEKDMREVGERHYQRGLADAKCGYENGFENGMIVAWDAARKISSMNSFTRDEIFGLVITSNILDENTAAEAIEKIRQYEQEKQEKDAEIKVGKEFQMGERKCVVTHIIDGTQRRVLWDNGVSGLVDNTDLFVNLTPTGRYFPEIATILEKMRGEQDG